ncbi:hypothetical protein B2M27_23740 [Kluyvera intermedia]|uniref:Uncharacterized protein n=1 Tax=Kluyvera intermedia TaxID=61648 RepID=A0ABX3U8G4_KLUIN|nr:hypothetical protein B2M27_23740 [Kluyvera intermedia]
MILAGIRLVHFRLERHLILLVTLFRMLLLVFGIDGIILQACQKSFHLDLLQRVLVVLVSVRGNLLM